MPSVQSHLAGAPNDRDANSSSGNVPGSSTANRLVENSCLFLPSNVLKRERERALDGGKPEDPAQQEARAKRWQALRRSMAPGIDQAEFRLREAQCNDALDNLRTKLYMRTRLYQYKKLNVRHQGPNTRANDALLAIQNKINLSAAKYRSARDAMMSLVGTQAAWEEKYAGTYLPLTTDDVRGLEDDDPATARRKKKQRKGPAEGRKLVSWIWRGAANTADGNVHESKYFPLLMYVDSIHWQIQVSE